jgi:hypothetical protein
MISTDITGGVGGDAAQVFNLLTVVANPEAYSAKLKALVEATEENKKFIALVAPASEIMRIREEIAGDKAAAKQVLKDAKQDADALKAGAKADAKVLSEKAAQVLADAQEQAAKLLTQAQAEVDAAKATNATLKAQVAATAAAEKEAKSRSEALASMQAEAKAEQAAAKSERAALAAKIEMFAKGL